MDARWWVGWLAALAIVWVVSGCPNSLIDDDDTTAADDDDDDLADDDATGDDDDDSAEDPCDGAAPTDPCCVDPLPSIELGSCDLPVAESVTGNFTSWGLGDVSFVTVGGATFTFQLRGTPTSLALLPDLTEAGLVTLEQAGQGCVDDGPLRNTVYVYRPQGEGQELVLLVGSVATTAVAGWRLDSPSNTASCPGRPIDPCNEFVHNRAVYLERGDDDPYELYQGTEAVIDDHDVLILVAQSGSGVYDCDEGPGTELDSWVIVPHVEPPAR